MSGLAVAFASVAKKKIKKKIVVDTGDGRLRVKRSQRQEVEGAGAGSANDTVALIKQRVGPELGWFISGGQSGKTTSTRLQWHGFMHPLCEQTCCCASTPLQWEAALSTLSPACSSFQLLAAFPDELSAKF